MGLIWSDHALEASNSWWVADEINEVRCVELRFLCFSGWSLHSSLVPILVLPDLVRLRWWVNIFFFDFGLVLGDCVVELSMEGLSSGHRSLWLCLT